jgi:hypothetical protein
MGLPTAKWKWETSHCARGWVVSTDNPEGLFESREPDEGAA